MEWNSDDFVRDYFTMACATEFTLTIGNDKEVYVLGSKEPSDESHLPVQIRSLSNIVEVSCSKLNTVFLDYYGHVWQSKIPNIGINEDFRPSRVEGIPLMISVACGESHVCCISHEFHIWSFGNGSHGQLGFTPETDEICNAKPRKVPGVSPAQKVQCGYQHSVVLTKDGAVFACGSSKYGRLGIPTSRDKLFSFTQVNVPETVDISCGMDYTVFLTDEGKVFACGNNLGGQLGLGNTENVYNTPTRVKGLKNIVKVSSLRFHTLCVGMDESLWSFGCNKFLGDTLLPVQMHEIRNVVSIPTGDGFQTIVKGRNAVWGFGENQHGQLGVPIRQVISSGEIVQLSNQVSHIFSESGTVSILDLLENRESYVRILLHSLPFTEFFLIDSKRGKNSISIARSSSLRLLCNSKIVATRFAQFVQRSTETKSFYSGTGFICIV